MNTEIIDRIVYATRYIRPIVAVTFGTLALFLFMLTVNEFRSGKYIGSGVTATNTITVTGKGEIKATPDIATFSVTIDEKAKDMKTARDAASKKSTAIVAYLKNQKIEDKDIQTADYGFSPQYEYGGAVCSPNGYCPPGKQILTGYDVTQTITVRVRDTTKAGDVLAGVGSLGASSVSGLTFTVDSEDLLQSQARTKAIDDAKAKAEALAGQLGVSLVRIVGFNEDGTNPRPIYMQAKASNSIALSAEAVPTPSIPTGENIFTSNVSVTYEIK